ncbi:MAG: type III-B CRISPR module RAMP protein Cmr4 [Myxococcales bacterium]|nr:type III-B CRISPR module RAMP protein Cmr4 [Myxococcales bacterium]
MSDARWGASGLLFLHVQTSLHAGSGTALGTIDLPVQRERHTEWPLVPGSSLKGILRDACRTDVARKVGGTRRDADADADLTVVFGPPTAEADKHAGALSITDARILAFPVRSLRGVFAWVTCPSILERLDRDLRVAGYDPLGEVPQPGRDRLACAADSPLLVDSKFAILEEFEFERAESPRFAPVAEWIARHAIRDDDAATRARLARQLVVLHDDDFTHFARHATEVVARIGLDYESKTVKNGALFYQEFVPPEALFYSIVLATGSQRRDRELAAPAVLSYVRERLPRVLQVGGDETTGKGLCVTRLDVRGA